MSSVLDRILAETREDLDRRRRETPLGDVRPREGERTFAAALTRPGISLIAEFKRRSPSAGSLAERPQLASTVRAYELGGAAALSILTEEHNFEGSLEDLRAARQESKLPILRKDFVLERYQLEEAVLAGADAVLLIVAALDDAALAQLQEDATDLNLDVLVEVHDAQELSRATAAGARIIGVNNRDLRDFSVDVGRTERLLGAIAPGVITVSESGIKGPAQLARLSDAGVDAVLVGETLMRAADPQRALMELLQSV